MTTDTNNSLSKIYKATVIEIKIEEQCNVLVLTTIIKKIHPNFFQTTLRSLIFYS